MRITILFGTESGNSEMVANDLADELAAGHDVEVLDMSDADPAELDTEALTLVVCSTYGDGELPCGAYPFFRKLDQHKPDLSGLRYAMFGLGDSSYLHTYSLGSEIIDSALVGCGAERVGEYGRHDAEEDGDPVDCALAWLGGVLENACQLAA